jgi:DNA mismatch repair protein MutL
MSSKKVDKRIYKLPMELANQIAAGEVVERPASVLKELLENSIDAGSTHIDITIEAGGIGLIKVQDNGCGICKEDLELALFQHATSKILSFSDLEEVISYGFRGEALASIAAVSRLTLKSYVEGQESGWSIQRQGRSNETVLLPMPRIPGTTIEVRDLFYNTPARRKFLRSEKTEILYIEEVFKKIALSQPTISFSFKNGDRVQKQLAICRNIEAETRRISELCGTSFMKSAHYTEAENNGLKLRGWLGSKAQVRSQADLQFFYVNDRSVRDKVVSHAIRQAYPECAKLGKYPSYVLFFEIDPASVDVNVHPTKHEVRFREARTIHAFLSYSIAKALSNIDIIEPTLMEERTLEALGVTLPLWEVTMATPEGKGEKNITEVSSNDNQDNGPPASRRLSSQNESNGFLAQTKTAPKAMISDISSITKVPKNNFEKAPKEDKFKPLSVLGQELLIGENSEGLVLVDIKTIKQRLVQETLKLCLDTEPTIPSRLLLRPIRFELKETVEQKKLLHSGEDAHSGLDQLGFQWTQLGPNSILIRAVPKVIKTLSDQFESLFKKLLNAASIEESLDHIADYVFESERPEITLEEANNLLEEANAVRVDVSLFFKIVPLEHLKHLLKNKSE